MEYLCADGDEYPVLTPGDMRRMEEKAFSLGVSSLLLMEHAAMAVVDELYPERGKVRVLVSFFGRETPVEMDFMQVERV